MNKLLGLIVCLALQACSLPRALPPANDFKAGEGEVIVVGKVEVVPPIDPRFEQRTHWNAIGDKRYLEHVLLATAAEHRPVNTSQLDGGDFQGAIEAKPGVPFMVKAPRRRTFMNGAVLHMDLLAQERLWFPGGFYFDVPKDAAAVYIGTLRYHRNDFNTITRVEVVDQREDIAPLLKNGVAVRPALLQRVR